MQWNGNTIPFIDFSPFTPLPFIHSFPLDYSDCTSAQTQSHRSEVTSFHPSTLAAPQPTLEIENASHLCRHSFTPREGNYNALATAISNGKSLLIFSLLILLHSRRRPFIHLLICIAYSLFTEIPNVVLLDSPTL